MSAGCIVYLIECALRQFGRAERGCCSRIRQSDQVRRLRVTFEIDRRPRVALKGIFDAGVEKNNLGQRKHDLLSRNVFSHPDLEPGNRTGPRGRRGTEGVAEGIETGTVGERLVVHDQDAVAPPRIPEEVADPRTARGGRADKKRRGHRYVGRLTLQGIGHGRAGRAHVQPELNGAQPFGRNAFRDDVHGKSFSRRHLGGGRHHLDAGCR